MRVEVRATRPGEWRQALALPGDGLLVGDSTCPRRVPELAELQAARRAAAAAGRTFRVELPPAYEQHFAALRDRVLDLAASASAPGLAVVVNDWGLLAALSAAAHSGALRLAAGPLLCYSFAHCPWYEEISADELPEIADGVRVLTLDSPHGLALCSRLGVSAVEVDLLADLGPSWSRLVAAGLAVSGRVGATLLAASRVCHTVRLQNGTVGDCRQFCTAPITLETTHRWRLFDNTQQRLATGVRRGLPPLALWGNAVYVARPALPGPSAVPPEHLAALAQVVLDLRWAGREEILAWQALPGETGIPAVF